MRAPLDQNPYKLQREQIQKDVLTAAFYDVRMNLPNDLIPSKLKYHSQPRSTYYILTIKDEFKRALKNDGILNQAFQTYCDLRQQFTETVLANDERIEMLKAYLLKLDLAIEYTRKGQEVCHLAFETGLIKT